MNANKDAEISFDDETGNIVVTLPNPTNWCEHVYSGRAVVSLCRAEPQRDQPDRIVRIDIDWEDEP